MRLGYCLGGVVVGFVELIVLNELLIFLYYVECLIRFLWNGIGL